MKDGETNSASVKSAHTITELREHEGGKTQRENILKEIMAENVSHGMKSISFPSKRVSSPRRTKTKRNTPKHWKENTEDNRKC